MVAEFMFKSAAVGREPTGIAVQPATIWIEPDVRITMAAT